MSTANLHKSGTDNVITFWFWRFCHENDFDFWVFVRSSCTVYLKINLVYIGFWKLNTLIFFSSSVYKGTVSRDESGSCTLLSISYTSYQVGHSPNVFLSAQYSFRERRGYLFLKQKIFEQNFICHASFFLIKLNKLKRTFCYHWSLLNYFFTTTTPHSKAHHDIGNLTILANRWATFRA